LTHCSILAHKHQHRHHLFDVRVGSLAGIVLGAIAVQVEDLVVSAHLGTLGLVGPSGDFPVVLIEREFLPCMKSSAPSTAPSCARQPNIKALPDELGHCPVGPQRVRHVQMIGRILSVMSLHTAAPASHLAASHIKSSARSRCIAQGLRVIRLVTPADVEHARTAQPGLRRNLVVGPSRFARSDDLHAALVPCVARQGSRVGCFHHAHNRARADDSSQ
jgi:hypothetical protein